MTGKTALIYGSGGALGSALVDFFTAKQWRVIGIDLRPTPNVALSVQLDPQAGWDDQKSSILQQLRTAHIPTGSVDAVLCVAGGWAGGNVADDLVVRTTELMVKQSVLSSVLAAHLGSLYLRPGGFVALTGAQPALGGTGGMIGYGLAKAAVHQLTQSLASKNSGLPEDTTVVCIMPSTLDTPANRAAMPSADHSTWTPLTTVASQLYDWASKTTQVEVNGGLYRVQTVSGGQTTFTPVSKS